MLGLLFLCRDVLEIDLPWLDGVARAKRPHRLPIVLTRHELHDIRTVQELLGHRDVSTTRIYTHVRKRGPASVRSPADRMFSS